MENENENEKPSKAECVWMDGRMPVIAVVKSAGNTRSYNPLPEEIVRCGAAQAGDCDIIPVTKDRRS